jgi:hypothetical protein
MSYKKLSKAFLIEDLRLLRRAPHSGDFVASYSIIFLCSIVLLLIVTLISNSQHVLVWRDDVKPGHPGCVFDPVDQHVLLSADESRNASLVYIQGYMWDNTPNPRRLNLYRFQQHSHHTQCRVSGRITTCDIVNKRDDPNATAVGYIQFGDSFRFSKIDWYTNDYGCANVELIAQGQGNVVAGANGLFRLGFTTVRTSASNCIQGIPVNADSQRHIVSSIEMRPKIYLNLSHPDISWFDGEYVGNARLTMWFPQMFLSPTLNEVAFKGICSGEISLSVFERYGIISGYMALVYTLLVIIAKKVLRQVQPQTEWPQHQQRPSTLRVRQGPGTEMHTPQLDATSSSQNSM